MRFLINQTSTQALLKRPRAAQIHAELLTKHGAKAIFVIALVRLSPIMPFAGTNLLLAGSRVKTLPFLVGSLLGLAPRIILVALAGAGLAKLDFSKSSNMWFAWVGGAATLLLIYSIGSVVKNVNSDSRLKRV